MVQVRRARPEEAPRIAAFQVSMAQETEGYALDLDVVTAGVQAVFEDPSKGTYWVAELGGELSGCLLTLPEWSDWRNGQVLWIHSVYVVPAARGRGVYRALYENLRRIVEEDPGLRGLRLYVDKRNQAAARVYESLGMTREHYHLYEWLLE